MKKILLLFTFILGIFSFAQNPNLLNVNWIIKEIRNSNNETFTAPLGYSNGVYFTNTQVTFSFFHVVTVDLTYYNTDTFFTSQQIIYQGTLDCFSNPPITDPICEFNSKYFQTLLKSNNYTYIINNFYESKQLILKNDLGDSIIYEYAMLSTEESHLNNISIYPNPVSDIIYLNNLKTNSIVKILDTSGKLILYKKLSGNSIDLKSLPKGIYILHVDGEKSLKFIKK